MTDALQVAAALKRPDGSIAYCNETVEKLFLRKPGEIINLTDFHLLPDSEAQEIRRNDRQVLETGESSHAVETTTLADGTLCYWLCERFRVNSPQGPLLAVVAVTITDLVRSAGLKAGKEIGMPRLESQLRIKGELVNIAKHLKLEPERGSAPAERNSSLEQSLFSANAPPIAL